MFRTQRVLPIVILCGASLLFAGGATGQTCVKHSDLEGCVPPIVPEHSQQCFPVASGPGYWQDAGGDHTWQYRRAIQSPADTCTPVPLGETIPSCCGGWPDPNGPNPSVSIRVVGKRVLIDYDAPNLYCTNVGDWPPNYSCWNTPEFPEPDRLTLSDAGGGFKFAFIYFEHGTWDTGYDIPCGTTVSLQGGIGYGTSSNPLDRKTALSGLQPLTATCADREKCPAGTSVSDPINVGSGNVMIRQPFFTIAQEPTSLPFTMTYHSSTPLYPTLVDSTYGLGWTHEYAQTLRPEPGTSGNRLYHITMEGYEHEYLRIAPDTFWTAVNPGELRGTVTQVGSEYKLTDLNGTVTSFDTATGHWNSTKDRWNNTISGGITGADSSSPSRTR